MRKHWGGAVLGAACRCPVCCIALHRVQTDVGSPVAAAVDRAAPFPLVLDAGSRSLLSRSSTVTSWLLAGRNLPPGAWRARPRAVDSKGAGQSAHERVTAGTK